MSVTADSEAGPPGMGFAAMLRGYRRGAGLTQAELADRAGLGVRTVRDLENGRAKRPQRGTVVLLANALALTGAARARFEAAARVGTGLLSETLPPPPDIVGRDAEIDELVRLIRQAEAVALLGLAGVGKTCLAVAVAHHAAALFPGGVAGVSVTEGAREADLLAAAAAGFGVARARELSERCGTAPTLLVIDGADQQPDAALAAMRWLRGYAPSLRLLITSRQPIDLSGVVAWPVSPLDAAAATELFVRRLRQVRPEPISPQEAAAVTELLRRLGGLPLAVELAAARGRILTVPQLLARYRDRVLDLGTTGPGPASAETLRDVVSTSYRLLKPPDQAALWQLAALKGRWSVEIAEALLVDHSGAEVEALLERLVGLGLVSVRGTGQWRFRLLTVVREYALERCTEAGRLSAVRDRHATVIASVAAAVAPRLAGPAMLDAVSTLDPLADDVRAALAHAGAVRPLTALRLAADIARWCRFRGRDSEARALLRKLLTDRRTAAADPGLRADAMVAVAMLAATHGDGAAELGCLGEALAVYRARGDIRGEVRARLLLARLHLSLGGYGSSREHTQAALRLARQADRVRDIALALRLLASHALGAGDLAGAHRRLATVARLAVGLGDERLAALATAQLAEVARLDSRYADGIELGRRAAARLAEYGDPDQRARALATVVAALAESARMAEAESLLPEVNDPGLYRLASAYVAWARGGLVSAANLFAAAADGLAGRRDVREVVDALVGAVACSAEPGRRATYRARLDAVLARGAVLLPRDEALIAGARPVGPLH